MESITKNVPGGSQHCAHTPLIEDFAHQCITDILEVILQQAKMLHPPFWYPCGHEQWPNPTTTTTYKQELRPQYTEQVKIKMSYKKVATLQKGLKMFLHAYILGPSYNQHGHKYQHTGCCSGKCGKQIRFGVRKSVSHEEIKMEVLPSPITNQSGHVSWWWFMAVLQSNFLFFTEVRNK